MSLLFFWCVFCDAFLCFISLLLLFGSHSSILKNVCTEIHFFVYTYKFIYIYIYICIIYI